MPSNFVDDFDNDDVIEVEHVKQYGKPLNELESGLAHYRVASGNGSPYVVDFTADPDPDIRKHHIATTAHDPDSDLQAGQVVVFKANVSNLSGPASLQLKLEDGLGMGGTDSAPIPLHLGDTQIAAEQVLEDQIVMAIYNDTATPRFDVIGMSAGGSGGATEMGELSDVDFSTPPADQDFLQHNGSAFVPKSPAEVRASLDVPTTSHTHAISDVTLLQASLDAKQNTLTDYTDVPNLSGELTSLGDDISANTTAISGKQDSAPVLNEIAGLDESPSALAKGDMLVHDGTNMQKLPSGSDGQILSANAAAGNGLGVEWSTPMGTGAVDSVFGRTGNVTAASGDYDASEVSDNSGVTSPAGTVAGALSQLDAAISTNSTNIGTNTAALSGKQDTADKGQPNGYAELDSGGKVPLSQLPSSGMGAQDLNDLSDVDVTSPVADHFLKHDGTSFKNVDAAAARSALGVDSLAASDISNDSSAAGADVAAALDGLSTGVGTNAANISTNTTNIGTNASDISANASAISGKQDSLTGVNDVPGMNVTSPQDGDILQYDSLSSEFKNAPLASAGFVDEGRTISTTGPLMGGGDLSQDRTISMPAADGVSQDGYLTSAKFAEFDAKQDALTGSGDVPGLTAELAAKEDAADKGQAGGYAGLDGSGHVSLDQGGTGADLSATGGAGQVLKQSSSGGAISVSALSAGDMPSGIDAAKIAGGSVSNTEFEYLDGVTSSIQGQLDGKQPLNSALSDISGLSFSPGDILFVDSNSDLANLGQGAEKQVLTISDGLPVWRNPYADGSLSRWDYSWTTYNSNSEISLSSTQAIGSLGTFNGSGRISVTEPGIYYISYQLDGKVTAGTTRFNLNLKNVTGSYNYRSHTVDSSVNGAPFTIFGIVFLGITNTTELALELSFNSGSLSTRTARLGVNRLLNVVE